MRPFQNWRNRYGGMEVSDARQLKSLEDKNQRLRKLLADFMLDVACLGPGAAMNSLTRSPDLGTRIHRSPREKVQFCGLSIMTWRALEVQIPPPLPLISDRKIS